MLVYTLIILYHCYVASITSGICLNIILTDGWPLCWLGSAVISPNTSRPATAYSRYATLATDLICSTYLLLGPAYNQSLSPLSPQPTVPTQPQLIICSLQHIFSSLPTSFLHTSHLSSAADSDHQSRGGEGEG